MMEIGGAAAFIVIVLREVFDFVKRRNVGGSMEAIQRFGFALKDVARELHEIHEWVRPTGGGFPWADSATMQSISKKLDKIMEKLP